MSFDATRLTQLGRVSAVALSPDRTWLAVQVARLDRDDKKYVSDLWRVSALDPALPPHQLTWGESSDSAPQFRRDGALGFVSDRLRPAESEDDRRRQVWLLPAAGGEPVPLTDEPLGVSAFRFARAADRLLVVADVLPGVPHEQQRERDRELTRSGPSGVRFRTMPVRFWDQWLGNAAPHLIAYDERGQERRDLTPAADREYRAIDLWSDLRFDVSADGRRAVMPRRIDGADRLPEIALDLFDLESGARTELVHESGAMYGSPLLSPDSSQLAATRQLREPGRCGRTTLWLLSLADGGGAAKPRPLAADWDVWPDIEAWTPDGRQLLCTADLEGRRPVFSVDVPTGEITRLSSEAAGGVHGGIDVGIGASGSPVAFGVRSAMLQPPEPFQIDVAPGAEPVLLGRLSGFTSEEAALARWESFDTTGAGGERVQAFLVRPAVAPAGPPVLMFIHGGPVGQHVDGWHWRWNPLVAASAGYAVVLPNPRGSTGRGQEFIEGVWNNQWGAACYQDLMAVADSVAARGDVDGSRMAALGGSFGGYMANWIGGQTDRFRCLVTHASIYHFPAFHGATDEPAFFAFELGGGPFADPVEFERYSPHRFVERWKTPTLIIHGEKDYRVPVSEALILFEALQHHRIESELLIFPDENHWVLKPRNSRQWYEAVLEFIRRHMGA